jgi:hypothetical protein
VLSAKNPATDGPMACAETRRHQSDNALRLAAGESASAHQTESRQPHEGAAEQDGRDANAGYRGSPGEFGLPVMAVVSDAIEGVADFASMVLRTARSKEPAVFRAAEVVASVTNVAPLRARL